MEEGVEVGVYRQLKEEHMKSHEGPRDAFARYILLKLLDRMVASHDLETHRRQNKLEIGKQRRMRSTSSPCKRPQMAGSIVVVLLLPSLESSSAGSLGLSFVIESSICVCTERSDTSSNNNKLFFCSRVESDTASQSVRHEIEDVPRVGYAYELPRALRVWRCAIPQPPRPASR